MPTPVLGFFFPSSIGFLSVFLWTAALWADMICVHGLCAVTVYCLWVEVGYEHYVVC